MPNGIQFTEKTDEGYVDGNVEILAAGANIYQRNNITNSVLHHNNGALGWDLVCSNIIQMAMRGDYKTICRRKILTR